MKKLISLLLVLMMLPMGYAFAAQPDAQNPYAFYRGTVTDVQDFLDADGNKIEGSRFVWIETEEQQPIVFIIDEQTVLAGEAAIAVGDTLIGFYDTRMPMTMIYPPQIHALAAAVTDPVQQTWMMAEFNDDLIDIDGTLMLTIGDETILRNPDGTAFTGELAGHILLVRYGASTRSIPAQTTPDEVIVMDIPQPAQPLDLQGAYLSDNGHLMLPLMQLADKLDLMVERIEGASQVQVGHASFTLGEDSYAFARMAPVQLGEASVAMDDEIYVPSQFFIQVLRLDPMPILSLSILA